MTVVTGAASGMGQACVERLRGSTEHLVRVDLRDADVVCDVTDPEALASLAEHVRTLGPLRNLVHAAGVSPSMGDVSFMLDVDLRGTALVLQAFDPLMVDGSAAVCFASTAGHRQMTPEEAATLDPLIDEPLAPDFVATATPLIDWSGAAYSWAKRGVLRLVRRTAKEWGPRGARVNSVSPGLINTPMGNMELANQPLMQGMESMSPLGRKGEASEVAAAVAFLLSDDASYVTGTDILVDGGPVVV